MTAPRPPRPLEATRERVIAALGVHFANDVLTLDELEVRIERAYKADSVAALDALVADLPAAPGASSTPISIVPVREIVETSRVVAVMGEARRDGMWTLPRRLEVRALMAEVLLDLRQARFPPGVTEIELLAVMANVRLIVAPGVRVENEVSAILGYCDVGGADAGDSAGPVVRIRGSLIMSAIEVRVREAGETRRLSGRRGRWWG